MEFNEKLQALRKQKGLTQEELARKLCVSRTAVSKWELGRGYPNIDSLKILVDFFDTTLDEVLSSKEVVSIAKNESKQKEIRFRNIVFGLIDLSVLMFYFLPLFSQKEGLVNVAVSLLSLNKVQEYLKTIYIVIASLVIASGINILITQKFHETLWNQFVRKISLTLNVVGIFVFIISSQIYAATLMFIFLIIKVLIIIKK